MKSCNLTRVDEYADAGSISIWAREAMSWASADVLVTGTSTVTLMPNGLAVRCQVAVLLMRFLEKISE